MRIRGYCSGDELAITELFKKSYHKEMPLEYWRWRFIENPVNDTLIELMWDEDILAGHYAISPVLVCVDGEEYTFALSMTTMTHLDYQGRGIFTYLAKRLYQKTKELGYVAVYGFPNDNSFHGFQKYLDWQMLWDVETLECHKLSFGAQVSGIYQVDNFDNRVEELWNCLKPSLGVATSRTSKYLNWRYAANPVNKYNIFYLQDVGTKLEGYIVVKIFDTGKGLSGDLVDFLAENETAFEKLVRHGAWYLGGKVDFLSTWMPRSSPLYSVLQNLGFRPGNTRTHFGLRVFQQNPQLDSALDEGRWYLTMGDSDVY